MSLAECEVLNQWSAPLISISHQTSCSRQGQWMELEACHCVIGLMIVHASVYTE